MKNNQSKFPKLIILSFLVAFELGLSGCSVPKMRRSPYLQNIDFKGFHKHEYTKNFVMYSKPDSEWQRYNKFILSPALVSINPTLEYQHINPTALKLTSDILTEEVQNNLRLEFKETTTASQNVINVKLALTNIMAPSRDKEIGSMQIGLIPIGLNGAVFEAYLEDALSGELLAIIRDERIGLSDTTKFYKGFSSSNFFHHSFALWGTELCNILLEKTGRKRKEENNDVLDDYSDDVSEENLQSQEEYSSEQNSVIEDYQIEERNELTTKPHPTETAIPTETPVAKVTEVPTKIETPIEIESPVELEPPVEIETPTEVGMPTNASIPTETESPSEEEVTTDKTNKVENNDTLGDDSFKF